MAAALLDVQCAAAEGSRVSRRDPARRSGFGALEAATAARETEMELRHRGGCPGPGGVLAPPPREGESAGDDHETESTSDKVS